MKPSETLVAYIEAEIIPRYAAFDRAHDERHVRTVIERSLALAGQLGADADMAYTVAAYHDTAHMDEVDFRRRPLRRHGEVFDVVDEYIRMAAQLKELGL